MYYCLRYMTHNPNTYSVCYSIIRPGQVFGFVYECVYDHLIIQKTRLHVPPH